MKEKEKAQELFEKYLSYVECGDNIYNINIQMRNAKQCATICVDEILKALYTYNSNYLCNLTIDQAKSDIEYYNRVKQEIENL